MAHKQSREVDGNKVSRTEVVSDRAVLEVAEMDDTEDQSAYLESEPLPAVLTLKLSRALIRKLTDYAREEGVTREELAAELVSEGVVLRAWEIVEKKATMRGGQGNQNFNRPNNNPNPNGNVAGGNAHTQTHQQRPQFQPGGNKMAQKKLQRQARQHANAMDLMSDKAAFLEYVRNQEKKRR